jgi:hypothetical protein
MRLHFGYFVRFAGDLRVDYQFWHGTNSLLESGNGLKLTKLCSLVDVQVSENRDFLEAAKSPMLGIIGISLADALTAGDFAVYEDQIDNKDLWSQVRIEYHGGAKYDNLQREDVPVIPFLAAAFYGQSEMVEDLIRRHEHLGAEQDLDAFTLAAAGFCKLARDKLELLIAQDPALVQKACPNTHGHPLVHHLPGDDMIHPFNQEG